MERNAAATALVAELSADRYGAVLPSVYETARLVTLAPWLAGHGQRIRFLLRHQWPHGNWGGPGGYGLVPTLSATEALLTCLRRWRGEHGLTLDYGRVVEAANRGLRVLFKWLRPGVRISIPDTIAVEILVPALIGQINVHLDQLGSAPLLGMDVWGGSARLFLPDGMDNRLLDGLRDRVRQGHPLPVKLWHSLEALGLVVQGARWVRPADGAVGCSPAATAMWLDTRNHTGHPGVDYLVAVQQRNAGPVPGVAPITVFERAWVLAALTSAKISVEVPRQVLDVLHTAIGEHGASAGPGLPPDADDTAVVLYALAQLGSPRSPGCLSSYQRETYFCCFPGECTPSVSSNAHVLQTFGRYGEYDPAQRFCNHPTVSRISRWLRDHQEADGSWSDKWHASPYYATARCAMTLHRFGGRESAAAVRKAVKWLLDTQHADGSWGRWNGTYEETAYALQTLLQTWSARPDHAVEYACAQGCLFLERTAANQEYPPLWHDKDLYTPTRVVQAEGLAARQLAYANPQVAATICRQFGGDCERKRAG